MRKIVHKNPEKTILQGKPKPILQKQTITQKTALSRKTKDMQKIQNPWVYNTKQQHKYTTKSLSSYQLLILLQKTNCSIKNNLWVGLDMLKIKFISSIPNCPSGHDPSSAVEVIQKTSKEHENIIILIRPFRSIPGHRAQAFLAREDSQSR